MLVEDLRPFVRFVRYLTLDAESSYPLRIPLDARLFYTVSGRGRIETAGSVSYEMRVGTCLILPSGTGYRLCAPEKSVTYLALNFDFNADASTVSETPAAPVLPEEYSESLLTDRTKISGTEVFSAPLFMAEIQIENELIEIEREYRREYEYHRAVTGNILHNILLRCARRRSVRPGGVRLDVELILDYISENCEKVMTNSDIASHFGFNANYISDTVKRCTGMPLRRYIIHMRIVRALRLFECGHSSVSEVAALCGFSDAAYFSRAFKNETGMPPKDYGKFC